MLPVILAAVVLLAGGLLAYAATRPDHFRIERAVSIDAPPERIFPLINDFHAWEAWSPWETIDPQLIRTYSGATAGRGAIYEWNGNRQVGRGRMEIVASEAPQRVEIRLDFMVPFEAHNTVEFTLEPMGGATRVRQAMFGPSPLLSRLMGLVFSMDKMVGGKYEEGLARLKALVEARP